MGIRNSKPSTQATTPKIQVNQRPYQGVEILQGAPPLENIFSPAQPKNYVPPSHLLNPPAMAASTNFSAYFQHNCNHPQQLLETLVLLRNASAVHADSRQINSPIEIPATISYPPAPTESRIAGPPVDQVRTKPT